MLGGRHRLSSFSLSQPSALRAWYFHGHQETPPSELLNTQLLPQGAAPERIKPHLWSPELCHYTTINWTVCPKRVVPFPTLQSLTKLITCMMEEPAFSQLHRRFWARFAPSIPHAFYTLMLDQKHLPHHFLALTTSC